MSIDATIELTALLVVAAGLLAILLGHLTARAVARRRAVEPRSEARGARLRWLERGAYAAMASGLTLVVLTVAFYVSLLR